MIIQRLQSNQISRLGSIVQWILFLVFAILYLVKTYQLSSYAPYLDDYEALLNFLISVEQEDSWLKKWSFVLQQHNEHRIIVPRLIVWLQYLITGELNLRITLLIGNLFLVLIVFILIHVFFSKALWGIKCAAIFLLFNYMHFENFQWALSALQNYGVVLLALASLMYCSRQHYKRMLLFSMLAALCSSSGILIFFVYGVYFLLRKKYFWSGFYFLLLLLSYVAFYKFGYEPVHKHPGAAYMLQHPSEVIQYFFILSSSYVAPFMRQMPSATIIIGLFIIILNMIYTTKLFIKDRFNILIYLNLFIYLVFFGITFARFNFGLDQAFASRYIIFSVIHLLLTLAVILHGVSPRHQLWRVVISLSLFFFSACHNGYSILHNDAYIKGVKHHLNNTLCLYINGENPIMPYIGKNDPIKILKQGEALKILNFTRIKCD